MDGGHVNGHKNESLDEGGKGLVNKLAHYRLLHLTSGRLLFVRVCPCKCTLSNLAALRAWHCLTIIESVRYEKNKEGKVRMYKKGGSGKVSRNRGGRRMVRGTETRARKRAYTVSLKRHFIAGTHCHLHPTSLQWV